MRSVTQQPSQAIPTHFSSSLALIPEVFLWKTAEGHRIESHSTSTVLWWMGKLGETQVMVPAFFHPLWPGKENLENSQILGQSVGFL